MKHASVMWFFNSLVWPGMTSPVLFDSKSFVPLSPTPPYDPVWPVVLSKGLASTIKGVAEVSSPTTKRVNASNATVRTLHVLVVVEGVGSGRHAVYLYVCDSVVRVERSGMIARSTGC